MGSRFTTLLRNSDTFAYRFADRVMYAILYVDDSLSFHVARLSVFKLISRFRFQVLDYFVELSNFCRQLSYDLIVNDGTTLPGD
jgi:hypothetical protein